MDAETQRCLQAIQKRLGQTVERLSPQEAELETQCPYLVLSVAGGDDMDITEMWDMYLADKLKVNDYPGYEAHNQEHSRLALKMGLPPKCYINFDPADMEGIDYD